MSQRITLNPPRVPICDPQTGLVTPEWWRYFAPSFERMGGADSFSTDEIFGDYTSQQAYDELLERVGALEAMVQAYQEAVQQLGQMVFDTSATQPPTTTTNTFDSILVRGPAQLARNSGRVLIGNPADDGVSEVQVAGDMRLTGTVGAQQANVTVSYEVAGTPVVGSRATGWGTPTGTFDRSSLASYAGQAISATYSQSQVQALDDSVKALSQHVAALITDLRIHGLIGT